jgi:trk system potassium uptake protein TrkA
VKTVIVGCGRVGAVLADSFDRAGHEVIVVDLLTRAFDRLPSGFGGNALRGDGTDEDTLRRAGAEDADVFIALTEGDNRNIMATQLAHEALGAKQVIAKINDPLRAEAYGALGIATICRTNLMSDAIHKFAGMPAPDRPGVVAPSGSHPGGDHHRADGEVAAADGAGSGSAAAAGSAEGSGSAAAAAGEV